MAHTASSGQARRLLSMEWMLQVADELDDAVGAFRLYMLSWSVELAKLATAAAATAQREVRFQRRKII